MEDLSNAYPSISAWLANQAVDARFELARFVAAWDKYSELPSLKRFLESAAGARIKYPERMKNLDAQFLEFYPTGLIYLEKDLFDILEYPIIRDKEIVDSAKRQVVDLGRRLHAAAEALFKMDKRNSEKLREFIDTQCV